jgi:hypothetical protein
MGYQRRSTAQHESEEDYTIDKILGRGSKNGKKQKDEFENPTRINQHSKRYTR